MKANNINLMCIDEKVIEKIDESAENIAQVHLVVTIPAAANINWWIKSKQDQKSNTILMT